jgi:hypothetical protein
MKRLFLTVLALCLMVVLSALALQNERRGFALLDWPAKAAAAPVRTAILLEFGIKDLNLRDWSGRAEASGAKVVHREGYRFRTEDKLVGQDAWQASTHRAMRAPKKDPVTNKREPLATVGVVLQLENIQPDAKLAIQLKGGEKAEIPLSEVLSGKAYPLWKGEAVARLVTAAQPLALDNTEDDFPAAAYGPDGTLWVAYCSYTVRDNAARIEQMNLKQQPKDFKSFALPEYADQLFLRSHKDGKWGAPIAVTGAKEDLARCAVAVDGKGNVWVAYSAHRGDNFDIYARKADSQGTLGTEQRLTKSTGPDLTPAMCTDAAGEVWLAWQAWDDKGRAHIAVLHTKDGAWPTQPVSDLGNTTGNNWSAALAAAPDGRVAVANDGYANGSYNIYVAIFKKDGTTEKHEVANTAKFEVRPALVFDAQNRLWIAYEEGPEKWGKDYGAFAANKGKPIYNQRSVRVICLDADGKLQRPSAELPTSHYEPPVLPFDALKTAQYEKTPRYAFPRIGLDGQGNVWLSYRRNFGTRYSSHPGSYWLTFVRRLNGQNWSDEIEVNHSDGLLDHRPVLLPHGSGGLLVVHNTDGRLTTPEVIDNQVYASVVALPGRGGAPQLLAHEAGPNPASPEVAAENEAVRRMRGHKIAAGGKTYHLYRGEYHRHTEISWDGGADGALEDMFRYGQDAAQLDWLGNGDHDNGAGREYPWWLIQKFSDAYKHAGFTPMFTYERSVGYPHGHRNVMFAQRGMRTLPRLAAPAGEKPVGGAHPDDTKMLYRYLHELGGLCSSHTSATGMGTDWRDNDPVVEPIVEIYQGDRMSYEKEGAPRSGNDPQTGIAPSNVAGWFPKGYINLALEKGYKLGFQSSSDHWSTHISFFIILAEGRDRASLLDAILKRRCYGATDNILVDFRSGEHLMGSEVISERPPTFSAHVVGTAPLAKVEVLRDSEVVATLPAQGAEYKGEWTDPQPRPGSHYYYLRVQQADGELAWASPIWVGTKK